jgi:uncharacterized membrane protein
MQKAKDLYHTQTFSTRRIEALTDGVFAIAMTLLILDIKVSDFAKVSTSSQLWDTLQTEQTAIFSFIVSFLLLGSMWAVHMRQFEFIKQCDRRLTMINTIRLLVVVFIPLTTSISSSYSQEVLGRVLLPLNFLLLALVSWWQWSYAVSSKNALKNEVPSDLIAYSAVRNIAVVILGVAIFVTSIWLGNAAFALFLLTPLVIKAINPTAKPV